MATHKDQEKIRKRGSGGAASGKDVLAAGETIAMSARILPIQQTPLPGLSSAVAQLPAHYMPAPCALPQVPLYAERPAASARRASRRTGVRQRFGELRVALAEGWEIVQPIFARPLWSAADDSIIAFSFVLRREGATRLLTVPEGRTVQRFVRDHQLIIDYRR